MKHASNFALRALLAMAIGVGLSACGGGGGDSTSGSGTTYPLQAAYKARLQAGSARTLTISGTCSGTAVEAYTPATSSSYGGVSGYAVTFTIAPVLNNCTTLVAYSASTLKYYDASFQAIAEVEQVASSPAKTYYSIMSSSGLPAQVAVGATGQLWAANRFSDAASLTQIGTSVATYEVQDDSSASSVRVLLTRKTYDTAGVLQGSDVITYRLGSDATLTELSRRTTLASGQYLVLTPS